MPAPSRSSHTKLAMWITAVAAHTLFRPAMAAMALAVLLAAGAAYTGMARAQGPDDSSPPTFDLSIDSKYGVNENNRTAWQITVKHIHIAGPRVGVDVQVMIVVTDAVGATSTTMWNIRDLSPDSSASRIVNRPGVRPPSNELVPLRLYAEIVETSPAEVRGLQFNNATEHWGIGNRRARTVWLTNGDTSVGVSLTDRFPQAGGTTTFTVLANNAHAPSIAPSGFDDSTDIHTQFDVQVRVSLSPGLALSGTQPPSGTTFNTSTRTWDVGLLEFDEDAGLSLPVTVTLSNATLEVLPLEERCLTADVVSAVPWPSKRENDTATVCLGEEPKVVPGEVPIALFHYNNCVGVTSTPCTSDDTLEVFVLAEQPVGLSRSYRVDDFRSGRDLTYLQPGTAIVHVEDPGGRDGATWKTGTTEGHDSDAPDVPGTQITFSFLSRDYSAYTFVLSDVSPKQRPGVFKILGGTQANFTLLDADTKTSLGPVNLPPSVTSSPYSIFLVFGALGTYRVQLTFGATKSGTAYTDSGTYTFHVGPISELEVRDGGASPAVAAGQSAYTIMAVNNGPDIAPDVRVIGLPRGATALFASEGGYDPDSGVWTIGELDTGPIRHASGMTQFPTLTLAATSTTPITPAIENTENYTVCVGSDGADVAAADATACGMVTGASWHTAKYYDYIPENNTTTIEARAGTGEGSPGAPPTTTVNIHGPELALLSWIPVQNLYGHPVTGYEVERSERGASLDWEEFADADEMFHYAHSGGGGGNMAYRVRAVNEFGVKGPWSQVATTEEQTVRGPSKPGNLMATVDGNDITLTWDAPTDERGSAVTGYRIDRQRGNSAVRTLVSDTATTTRSYEDTTGIPGARFCYRVAAVNANGDGEFSDWECATTEDVPGAPWNLQASPASETSIRLNWNPPSDDGGSAITGYLVQYYDGDAWQTLESGLAATTYEHTERDAGTNYCYRVAAINSNGTGPYSGQSCATTQGAPENLGAEPTGKTSITLTWDAPADTGGATIIGYRIDYSTDGGANWQTQEHSYYDYERRTYGHTGLTPGTGYCYRVAAVHDNGTGPFSNEVCATTEGNTATDLPGEPENLRLTKVGRNSVTLKWDPPGPGQEAGEVEYYEWRSNIHEPTRVNGTTATVSGLSDRETYGFHVRAVNAQGEGEWAPDTDLYAAPGGTTVTPRPLELKVKKGEVGSFNVRLGSSPKWPLLVSLFSWDGDVCLTDELIYQTTRYLLPGGDPPPGKEFWNDHYWGPPGDRLVAPWNTGIDFRVDASRCHGGETAVAHLTVGTLPLAEIAGTPLWDEYGLKIEDWSSWGEPEVYQSGPSVKISVVE